MKLSRDQIIALIKSGKCVVMKREGDSRYRDLSLRYAAGMEAGALFRTSETQHEVVVFLP